MANKRGYNYLTLTKSELNKKYIVEDIDKSDYDFIRKMCSMGILPGVELVVKQKKPSIIFEVYHSRFAVDSIMGEKIYVKSI